MTVDEIMINLEARGHPCKVGTASVGSFVALVWHNGWVPGYGETATDALRDAVRAVAEDLHEDEARDIAEAFG